MTEEQFNNLRIGDEVLQYRTQRVVKVIDIDRPNKKLQTGTCWRRSKEIQLPPPEFELTPEERLETLTFPVKMLTKYGLLQSCVILSLQRAGKDGFVGTMESLAKSAQVYTTANSCRGIINLLVRSGAVTRERLTSFVYRFKLTDEALDY